LDARVAVAMDADGRDAGGDGEHQRMEARRDDARGAARQPDRLPRAHERQNGALAAELARGRGEREPGAAVAGPRPRSLAMMRHEEQREAVVPRRRDELSRDGDHAGAIPGAAEALVER